MRAHPFLGLCCFGLVLLLCGCCVSTMLAAVYYSANDHTTVIVAARSGVRGKVVFDSKFAPQLAVLSDSGNIVSTISPDSSGSFTAELAPGRYQIISLATSTGAQQIQGPLYVSVFSGRYTDVTVIFR